MDRTQLVQELFSTGHFSTLDWVIVIGYVSISIFIGVFANRFIKGVTEYVVAGRNLGTALSVATMTGTEMGLITVMYSAQKGFTGGFASFHIAVVACVMTFIVGVTGFIVVPLRRCGVMTIPEFYERRFGRRTRILGGFLLAFGGILNMGLFLKVGSQFVIGVTGIAPGGGLLMLVMTSLIVLVLFYTILGGMISVVLADYVQFTVLSLGLVLLVCLTLAKLGWTNMIDVVQQQMGPAGFDPTEEGVGFGPAYISWQAVSGLVSCAIWPTAVARALAARNTTVVKRQYMLSSISFLIRFMIPYFLGIAAFVYIIQSGGIFQQAFFPTDDMKPVDNLYAMPLFVSHVLPIGVLGLVTAAMIAAFMSTHDSYLLCWSSVIVLDIINPMCKKPLSDKGQVLWARLVMVMIGIYILVWGLWYEGSDDIWEYMTLTGGIYTLGAISVLVGGLYWKRASSTGAVFALLAGFSAIFGLSKVRVVLNAALEHRIGFELTAPIVGLITLALCILAMIVGSLLFPDKEKPEFVLTEVK